MKPKHTIINPMFNCIIMTCLLTGTLPQTAIADGQLEIKATIKADCSLSTPEIVDLGDIPITAFDGKGAGEEVSGYNSTFTVSTSCSGTDSYVLTFTPTTSADGCLAASSGGIHFCLYDSANQKITLAATGATLTGSQRDSGEQISVIPARGSQAPTAGEHSGTLTVTIAPN